MKMKLESDTALLGKRDIIARLYARPGYPEFTSELRSVAPASSTHPDTSMSDSVLQCQIH